MTDDHTTALQMYEPRDAGGVPAAFVYRMLY